MIKHHRKALEHTPRASSLTIYEPKQIKRRWSLEPIDLVVIIAGASLILFGIHPFFELVAAIGDWWAAL